MYRQIVYLLISWFILRMDLNFCNGFPHKIIDPNTNHTAEALQRLLQVFGLEKPHSHSRHHLHPPQYMLDLYRWLADGSSDESLHLHHNGANTVRSFYSKGSSEGGHYNFDISSGIPEYEEIVEAQFHFFTNLHTHRSHQGFQVIQINLYDDFLNSSSSLLEAKMVSSDASGWEVFRITSSAKRWMRNPDLNKGLTVEILDGSGRTWRERRIHRFHSHRRPILIVFSQDTRTASTHRKVAKSYNSESLAFQSSAVNQKEKRDSPEEGNARNPRSAIPNYGDCERHELRVDFEKLGWSTWIISPKWYDAYVCAGACDFPLGQNQRPSNHATVQSIVSELGLTAGVGAPSCVPTELHSVSLLYFDEHMNVVLKQYDDMVAASCGCQ